MKSKTKKILKIIGLSLLGLIVLLGLYWVFAVHDSFEKQRSWTCKNYQLVCRNLRTCLTCDTLTDERLKEIFPSGRAPVINENQKEAKL